MDALFPIAPPAPAVVDVLVVDDQPEDLSLMSSLLSGPGVRVIGLGSGEEAFRRMAELDPALVILDIKLRGVGGFEVARWMRADERLRLTPIIFLTAFRFDELGLQEGYSLGAFDYLSKPIEPALLRAKVGAFVELFRLRRRALVKARLLQTILIHAPAGLALLDDTCAIASANPAFARLAGRQAEHLQGQPIGVLLPEREAAQVAAVLSTGRPLRLEGLALSSATGAIPVDASFDRVDLGGGGGIVVVCTDATERLAADRAATTEIRLLREADQLKDDLLSIVSHELRTPLNAIMAFASVLEEGVAGPLVPRQQEFVRRILAGSDLLLSQVNNLLDVGRVKAGKLRLWRQGVDFERTVRDALSIVEPLAVQRSQQLGCQVAELPEVWLDEERSAQVVINLVTNAIKFSPDGTSIRVRYGMDGGDLWFEVEDRGIGIAAEDQPMLFRHFSQLDMSTTRPAGGTGLGLVICKALIEAHGGTIGCRSEPGRGSTFWFRIPSATLEAADGPAISPG